MSAPDMELVRAISGFSEGIDSRAALDSLDRIRQFLGWTGVGLIGRLGTRAIRGDELGLIEEATGDPSVLDGDASEIRPGLIGVGLVVEGVTVGALLVTHPAVDKSVIRTVQDIARCVETQLAAHELGAARASTTHAQLLALKAQIRPHFIYNALNVIASFTITDPERARALITEFASFTRYWYGERGTFTTFADELHAIESYLLLERARYGERLTVHIEASPESLATRIPHLSIQPLIENAVRHGIESGGGRGSVSLTAHDEGVLTIITVEDDGIGMNPDRVRAVLAGELESVHVGLRNVDVRLRQIYGSAFGLVVETAPGEGTLITVRVPKFALDREF
ncbi:histidine kinase [Nocardia vinacea]|uniref:sensor histidine kinase n=1 Tax=Nocardia vinacea TaxID=96468 RepID=UPI002E11BEE9|nr:histidine kinase [Nocardia vinacea]